MADDAVVDREKGKIKLSTGRVLYAKMFIQYHRHNLIIYDPLLGQSDQPGCTDVALKPSTYQLVEEV